MSLLLRSLTALWLAVFLFVVTGVPVHAQRPPYEGDLFWMSGGVSPGDYWLLPPERAWDNDYTLATSYPDYAVWEWGVTGAPPNDACFGVGEDPWTDVDFGPYGLQVVQYHGEWWQGTTFLEHPRKPAGWSNVEFGSFSLTPGPHAGPFRTTWPAGGGPGYGPGNPMACVGVRLAEQRGSGDDGPVWEAVEKDQDGRPCYSDVQLIRLRSNTELRCEPNLGDDQDPMTQRYWPIFDGWPLNSLPDGVMLPPMFPPDYPAHSPWARRVEVGMKFPRSEPGDEPMEAVFNITVPGGASLADALNARKDEYKGFFPDLVWAANECDARDVTYSMIRPELGMADPCAIYQELTAPGSFEERDRSVLIEDPVQLASSAPLLPEAQGVRQPEPPGGGFWNETRVFSLECDWGMAAYVNLIPPALASVVSWDQRFQEYWAEYMALPPNSLDPAVQDERERLYGLASRAFMIREGWETIVVYRTMVDPEMRQALGGAYAVGGGSVSVGTVSLVSCASGPHVRLKGLRVVNNNSGTMPIGTPVLGGPGPEHVLHPQDLQDFKTILPERAPHYWQSDGSRTVEAAATSDLVFAAGSEMPTAIEILDHYDSELLWEQFSCGTIDSAFLAPDVPVFTPGYHDMEAGLLNGVEHNRGIWFDDAVVNHRGRLGTPLHLDTYSDSRLYAGLTSGCASAPPGTVTCAGYVQQHPELFARGTYAIDPLITASALAVADAAGDRQLEIDALNIGLVSQYTRLTSGDIDPVSGAVIMHRTDPEDIHDANDYAVTDVGSGYVLNVPISLDTGFPEIDMRTSGALAPGQSLLWETTHYWGVPRGTASLAPPSVIRVADEETLIVTGPVHYRGAMEFTKSGGYGACTLCSAAGCAPGVFEEFPEQRFTSPVTSAGTMVCLIERGLTPPLDCPGR